MCQMLFEVVAIDVFVGHHLDIVTFGRLGSSACGRGHPWVVPRSTCACSLCKFARHPFVSHGCCSSSSVVVACHGACMTWALGTSDHSHGTQTNLNTVFVGLPSAVLRFGISHKRSMLLASWPCLAGTCHKGLVWSCIGCIAGDASGLCSTWGKTSGRPLIHPAGVGRGGRCPPLWWSCIHHKCASARPCLSSGAWAHCCQELCSWGILHGHWHALFPIGGDRRHRRAGAPSTHNMSL